MHWGEYEQMDWKRVMAGKLCGCCYYMRRGALSLHSA